MTGLRYPIASFVLSAILAGLAFWCSGCDPCANGSCVFDDGPANQDRAETIIWRNYYQEGRDRPAIHWVAQGDCVTDKGPGIHNPISGDCAWGIFVSWENTIYIYEVPNNPRETWVTYVHELRHAHLHSIEDQGGDGNHTRPDWEDTDGHSSVPHVGADTLHAQGVY